MLSGPNRVDVEIYGEYYRLKGDAPPEHMLRVARYVDQTMRRVMRRNPRLSVHKAAVLSAVNIADELIRLLDSEAAAGLEEEKATGEKKPAESEDVLPGEEQNEELNDKARKTKNKRKKKK